MQSLHRLFVVLLWSLFVLWLFAQLPRFVQLAHQGKSPIDFLAYDVAAQALQHGKSPYLSSEATLEIWRYFHQNERDLFAASARGQGAEALRELEARPQQPGPYVYPPSLALVILQLRIDALIFASLLLLSIFGFAFIWMRATQSHPLALLLIIFSVEVLTSLHGGNVELLLLFATLLAAWLLWHQQALLAAPLITLVVVIKPFYALFFIAFGLLQFVSQGAPTKRLLKTFVVTTGATFILVALEVVRWGPQLRTEALFYFRHALDYQWFVLPPPQQTPMSVWNRTPMQALISSGMSVPAAQWIALVLWGIFVGITTWRAQGRRLNFPLTFALAFVLLYWGRPVGWGLIYLELIVLLALWPTLQSGQRLLFISVVVALMASRWWALVLTARGYGMPLLTLQRAELPWETWIVLPGSWLLLLSSISQRVRGAQWPMTHSRPIESP
jgi:hypothetical protein